MKDKIIIEGLKVFAYHGVKETEKTNGQDFIVDCVLILDRKNVRFQDDIKSTISYSQAAKIIKAAMLDKSCDLIETAAEYIARDLFKYLPMLLEAEITLKKPNAPINDMEFEYMAVGIRRKREDFI